MKPIIGLALLALGVIGSYAQAGREEGPQHRDLRENKKYLRNTYKRKKGSRKITQHAKHRSKRASIELTMESDEVCPKKMSFIEEPQYESCPKKSIGNQTFLKENLKELTKGTIDKFLGYDKKIPNEKEHSSKNHHFLPSNRPQNLQEWFKGDTKPQFDKDIDPQPYVGYFLKTSDGQKNFLTDLFQKILNGEASYQRDGNGHPGQMATNSFIYDIPGYELFLYDTKEKKYYRAEYVRLFVREGKDGRLKLSSCHPTGHFDKYGNLIDKRTGQPLKPLTDDEFQDMLERLYSGSGTGPEKDVHMDIEGFSQRLESVKNRGQNLLSLKTESTKDDDLIVAEGDQWITRPSLNFVKPSATTWEELAESSQELVKSSREESVRPILHSREIPLQLLIEDDNGDKPINDEDKELGMEDLKHHFGTMNIGMGEL